MLLPGSGDRILAHEGYNGQMTGELASSDRPDNLFQPVAGTPARAGDSAIDLPAKLSVSILLGCELALLACLSGLLQPLSANPAENS